MNKFCVKGPTKLIGNVKISGSKNSALPILILTLLSDGEITIDNVPKIIDIEIIIKLLIYLGSKIEYNNSTCYIDNKYINTSIVPYEFSKATRASIWIIVPLLYRFNTVKTFFPGGCSIGERPIDLHINSLKKLGASFNIENDSINGSINGKFFGSTIILNKISVGATITIIGASVLAEGTTIIENAAKEPEISDVSNFLNSMGACIKGFGTNRIVIIGIKKLNSVGYYYIPSDRIETGTFLLAAAASRGNITCENVQPEKLKIVLNKLKKTGAYINIGNNYINLNMNNKRPKSISLYTAPYPGFPTDMQSQFSVLNSIGIGSSFIIENIFNNRFMHINELINMGANIYIKNNKKVIFYGVNNLFGSIVQATDLRSSMSLIIAGCIAIGETIINKANYVYRGYENIINKLKSLGANINEI